MALSSCDHTKDPQSSLFDAFRDKNLSDFMTALEIFNADANKVIESENGLSLFQKILLTPKSSDYIRMCIENGAQRYKKSSNGRYPLHLVIASQCPQNLTQFLRNFDRSKINVKHDGNKNAFHLLIDEINQNNFANVSECLKILLDNGCNPNLPDDNNDTPFYNLLKKQQSLTDASDLIKYFLDNSEVDVYTYHQDKAVELFRAQNKSLKLPEQKIQNIEPKFMFSLVVQRRDSEFESYFKAFKETCSNNSQNFHGECAKFLEMATIKNSPNIIELLLENVPIDVNVRCEGATWKFPPTFIACRKGYHKILAMFLRESVIKFCYEVPKDFSWEKYTGTTLLHEVCLKFGADKTDEVDVDYQKCFELLVNDRRCNIDEVINARDSYGCTPLHYTTRYKNEEATMALLKNSAYLCTPNNLGQLALHDINRDTFEKFLDESLVNVNKRIKKTHMYVHGYDEQELHLDYSFLIPPKNSQHCEISPLRKITKNNELKTLIKHPVLFSYLYIKWSKLSLLFNINCIMFAIFLLSFIVHIVLCQSIPESQRAESKAYKFFYGISILFVIMLTLRETMQCLFSVRYYFKSRMNWFEIALILLSLMVLFGNFDEDFQRVLRGMTILFVATEFLILAGTLPNLSISTHMVILRTVILTFLKSIALYSILLLGFAFCFYTLFGYDPSLRKAQDNNSTVVPSENDDKVGEEKHENFFSHPGIALIKTLVMLTGEFEFENLELKATSSYVIFVIFVFVITIVLFNLLNALAVSDTQEIKSQGELVDLIQRVSVLYKYEKVIAHGNTCLSKFFEGSTNIFQNLIPTGKVVVFPNDNNEIRTLRMTKTKDGDEEMQTLNNNNAASAISKNDYEQIVLNSWIPIKALRKFATMDLKIMKAIKHVLEEKKMREKEEDENRYRKDMDQKILRNILNIKMQYFAKNNNQQLSSDKNY